MIAYMDGIADDDDQARSIHGERDAYVAGGDIYLTNKQSLADELAKFAAINSRMRANMLIRYAADDGTLQDATVLLMHARLGTVTAALRMLLTMSSKEEDLALSLLDSVDETRMQDLVDELKSEFPFLESFPQAVEEISKARKKTPRVGEGTGSIVRAWESKRGTRGFCRSYMDGRIYWSSNGGANASYGAINAYYDAHSGSGGELGFPLSPEGRAQPGGSSLAGEVRKTEGRYQRFEGPSDYSEKTFGATVYWCEEFGAHGTSGPIGELYELNHGTGGWLGFPVEDEAQVKSRSGAHALRQRFQGGVIYYRDKTGAILVPYPIAACHNWDRRVDDTRLPEGQREDVEAANSSGTKGYRQRFERKVTVYESVRGVYIVGWGNLSCYNQLGGPASWLGFPKSEEELTRRSDEEPHSSVQEFEGGAIFYKDGYGSVPIPNTVLESLAEHSLRERIGFPVSEDYSLAGSPADRIYFFENGIVTVREGVAEPWLRPGLAGP
jgi:LGFP repeat-containing protein